MKTTWIAISLATCLPLAAAFACDLSGATANPGALASAAGGCPDVSSVQAIAKVDWAAEFGLEADVGAKLKAGLQAAVNLKKLGAEIDADLKTACGGLATDLGGAAAESGTDSCKAALTAMADIKGKLGGNAKIALDMQPPRCEASLDAMANCVGECDANLEPGSVEVECEKGKLAGSCDAECSGSCEMSAAAKCEGTCSGSCSANFSGSCGGECNGKCDGKNTKGECNGKCEGSCSANAEGSCGGECSGSCEMSAAAKCEGTCRGDCSVEMKAPKCEGEITPPKASAECNASCNAQVSAELECTPPQLGVRLAGAADANAAATYKAALEKNLPVVLNVAIGMKDRAASVAASGKAVVDGVQASIKGIGDATVGARLSACVAAPVKGALEAAASIQANVSVSVEVQASASASGSAGGSASAG